MMPPKRWKASSDSQMSMTRHPSSVGPAAWERIPSTGHASSDSVLDRQSSADFLVLLSRATWALVDHQDWQEALPPWSACDVR